MKLKASLMRKESRCNHCRLDYPQINTRDWDAWINIYKSRGGSMKFKKQPFDNWPAEACKVWEKKRFGGSKTK